MWGVCVIVWGCVCYVVRVCVIVWGCVCYVVRVCVIVWGCMTCAPPLYYPPDDNTRVVLEPIPGEPDSDYINASFISVSFQPLTFNPSDLWLHTQGYKKPKLYIAAQGPMPNTVDDFWRMIWEFKLGHVVMLTKCREGGKVGVVYFCYYGDRLHPTDQVWDVLAFWSEWRVCNTVYQSLHCLSRYHTVCWLWDTKILCL